MHSKKINIQTVQNAQNQFHYSRLLATFKFALLELLQALHEFQIKQYHAQLQKIKEHELLQKNHTPLTVWTYIQTKYCFIVLLYLVIQVPFCCRWVVMLYTLPNASPCIFSVNFFETIFGICTQDSKQLFHRVFKCYEVLLRVFFVLRQHITFNLFFAILWSVANIIWGLDSPMLFSLFYGNLILVERSKHSVTDLLNPTVYWAKVFVPNVCFD